MSGIIKEDDYEIVERAYLASLHSGTHPNVLSLYEGLGYTIDAEFVEEVITVDEFEPFELKDTSMTFWVRPHEKGVHFAKLLRSKIESLGESEVDMVLLARKYSDKVINQKTDGLIRKRIKVPMYVSILTKACGLINCTTQEEIEKYELPF